MTGLIVGLIVGVLVLLWVSGASGRNQNRALRAAKSVVGRAGLSYDSSPHLFHGLTEHFLANQYDAFLICEAEGGSLPANRESNYHSALLRAAAMLERV